MYRSPGCPCVVGFPMRMHVPGSCRNLHSQTHVRAQGYLQLCIVACESQRRSGKKGELIRRQTCLFDSQGFIHDDTNVES
jgi:hypothetical protein